jgi:hypothetical protein
MLINVSCEYRIIAPKYREECQVGGDVLRIRIYGLKG